MGFADPDKAARKLLEITANTIEAVQDSRIPLKLNGPFLFQRKAPRQPNTAQGSARRIHRRAGYGCMVGTCSALEVPLAGAELFA